MSTRWTQADVDRATMLKVPGGLTVLATPETRAKYGNRKTGGYASKRESKRAAELKLLEKAGEIRDLVEQPKYVLIPTQYDAHGKVIERACHYQADFEYFDQKAAKRVTEDSKGFKNRVYLLKRKLMLHVHGIRILET